MESITFVIELWQLALFLGGIIVSLVALAAFLRHLYKKEIKFYKNLKRPIMVIIPTEAERSNCLDKDMTMQEEMALLEKCELFREPVLTQNHQAINRLKDHSLVVLGYCKGMKGFKEIVEAAKNRRIPLIIHTFGDSKALEGEDHQIIQSYPFHLISNFPLNLVSGVFTTLATFNHE